MLPTWWHRLVNRHSKSTKRGRTGTCLKARCALQLESLDGRLLLSSIMVTTTDDTGPGSLRQAILDANAGPGGDTIAFNIGGGGVETIRPASALPTITRPVIIDGTTQPGFAGSPLIELNGSRTRFAVGLTITAGSSTVKGLVINGFTGSNGAIFLDKKGGNLIVGNYLGTDITGTSAMPNAEGLVITANNNTIGGTTAEARNLISGNTGIGVTIAALDNQVQGNFIGTDITGTAALGNLAGVSVHSAFNTIGGTTSGARNLISGNTSDGIYLLGGFVQVQGNYIGTDVTGTAPLGNGLGVESVAESNMIGGTTAGARNLISGNASDGVRLYFDSRDNQVEGNYIGTDVTGTAALGNGTGVDVTGGAELFGNGNNTIGGTVAEAGNVISGNRGDGVFLSAGFAIGNQVLGNFIGISAAGARLGNGRHGVFVSGGASGTSIGGFSGGGSNTIDFNGQDGIRVDADKDSVTTLGTNFIPREPTNIVTGTLQLGIASGVGSAVTVSAGATLDLNNFDFAIGSLAGAGTVTLGSATLTIGADNTSTIFSGIITGTGGLAKVGSGTFTLTGDNLYTGTTTVSAGVLQVMGSQSASPVTIKAGATLGGTGTVGTITVTGTVSPGIAAPGILGVGNERLIGNATFNAGSSFRVQLNGTTPGSGYDRLSVSGAVDLSASPTLNGSLGFASAIGDVFTLIVSRIGIRGNFSGLPEDATLLLGANTFRIHYTATTVFLTHIASPTTTTLVSSVNPSAFGQPVILTATVTVVSPGTGTPAGTVTFQEGTTTLGTGTLDASGIATLTTSTLTVGTHAMTAIYNGGPNFDMSASAPLNQLVRPADTTTTLTSSINPASYGQSITFTVTVTATAPGSGTPTGTVTFLDGTLVLGVSTLANGQASLTTAALGVAAHLISAVYSSSDANFSMSTSASMAQTVLRATTKTVASPTNPSVFGQPVVLTATVTVVSPSSGTPAGTVLFQEGTTTLGTGTLDASGTATFTTSSLTAGRHTITASYKGDGNFGISTSAPLDQIVNQASTTTTLASSTNPTLAGQSSTFTANVTTTAPGTATPAGTVLFQEGTTTLGTGTLDARGMATITTSSLTAGTHAITATYKGDGNFGESTSATFTQTVTPILVLPPSPSSSFQPTLTSSGTTSPSSPSSPSTPASPPSDTPNTPAPKSTGTPNIDVGLLGLPGNATLLRSTGLAIGQPSPSSGTALSVESIRATPSHFAAAFAGPGSGSDEIAGRRTEVRPSDWLSGRFEPGLPASTDIISGVDLVGSLLTGRPPTASLLPQKGPSIAPVGVVVTSEVGDDRAAQINPSADEKSIWPTFIIGLDDTIHRRPLVAPTKVPDMSKTAETSERRLAVLDQIFEPQLPAVQDAIATHENHLAGTSLPGSHSPFMRMVPALESVANGRWTRSGGPWRAILESWRRAGNSISRGMTGHLHIPRQSEAGTGPEKLDVFETGATPSIDPGSEIPLQDATRCPSIGTETEYESSLSEREQLPGQAWRGAIVMALFVPGFYHAWPRAETGYADAGCRAQEANRQAVDRHRTEASPIEPRGTPVSLHVEGG